MNQPNGCVVVKGQSINFLEKIGEAEIRYGTRKFSYLLTNPYDATSSLHDCVISCALRGMLPGIKKSDRILWPYDDIVKTIGDAVTKSLDDIRARDELIIYYMSITLTGCYFCSLVGYRVDGADERDIKYLPSSSLRWQAI